MSSYPDMHDDEVRARLGLKPVDREMTMEERIEANAVRAMPEPEEVNPQSLLGSVRPE